MTALDIGLRAARGPVHLRLWLCVFLGLAALISLEIGAAGVSLLELAGKWAVGVPIDPIERVVLLEIRLPRTILGCVVGAGLAVSGAVMQGLFRNPLADPGIVGVGAGASLGAICAIVLIGWLPLAIVQVAGPALLPMAAFLGSWVTVLLLYHVATRRGQTSIATLLLAGIAIAALSGAVAGVVIYMADDAQLRDLTFWGMGALSGASWSQVLAAAPLILCACLGAMGLRQGLNALALGEAAAAHIGYPVQRLKTCAVLCVAAATGAAVAVSGGIGFVGIVVPHLVRLVSGPDHRAVLPGAALLVLADVAARLVVAPAELPIGIVTALMGAPVFLWILLRHRAPGGF